MKTYVYDCETNILNVGDAAVGTMQADPFHPDNHVVCYGEWSKENDYEDYYGNDEPPLWLLYAQTERVRLVGHNIAFDLMYALKDWPALMETALPNLYVWDTQQAEYLLSGQAYKFNSLDFCCERRSMPLKDDRIKQFWKDGIDTALIPKDLLLEYQKHDVMSTKTVFEDQWLDIRYDERLWALTKWKMDDILMSTMIQWHGMKFDLQLAAEKVETLDAEMEVIHAELVEIARPHFVEGFEFNPSSPELVSVLLFGGKYARKESVTLYNEQGEVLRYKTGQKAGEPKTRIETVVRHTEGLGLKVPAHCPVLKKGFYSTDAEYLVKVKHPFSEKLLRYKDLEKDSGTYFHGYSQLVWHDGCIHPSYNNTASETGRQSCSKPNLQNVSKDEE